MHAVAPKVHVLVVDDGSADETAARARQAGAEVITNVFNLGVGGAMRVGFRYGAARGYRASCRWTPTASTIRATCRVSWLRSRTSPRRRWSSGPGSPERATSPCPRARRWAMRMLAAHLSRVTHVRLTDVTSGYRAHNRAAIELFARTYPADYLADTVESLVIAAEAGGQIIQVPVAMRPRHGGVPSQSPARAALYLVRVTLMLALSIFRRRTTRTRTTKEAST